MENSQATGLCNKKLSDDELEAIDLLEEIGLKTGFGERLSITVWLLDWFVFRWYWLPKSFFRYLATELISSGVSPESTDHSAHPKSGVK